VGRRGLTISGLGQIYTYYQREFFPKLLEDPLVPMEEPSIWKKIVVADNENNINDDSFGFSEHLYDAKIGI